MPTIVARKRKDGTIGYTARVRMKRDGKVVYQETETFDRKPLALAWASKREAELSEPGALDRTMNPMTFGTLLTRCVEHLEAVEPIGRSKHSTLRLLTRSPIGSVSIHALTAPVIIEHCRQRKLAGISTTTINNDLVHIRTACKTGRAMFGLDIDLHIVEDATTQLKSLGWISASRKRTRRPTEDELTRLRAYFVDRSARRNNALPMADLMDFAIASCRRQEEITRIRWDTVRDSDRTAIISDLKHPRHKTGNDRRFKLLDSAWDIIQRQPRTESHCVFPFVSTTIGSAFTSACRTLDIKDLHFHDLRHHGVSLRFEEGYSIQEVQMISLHDSWTTLQRYTHLQPGDVQNRPRGKKP
jgi:integrase